MKILDDEFFKEKEEEVIGEGCVNITGDDIMILYEKGIEEIKEILNKANLCSLSFKHSVFGAMPGSESAFRQSFELVEEYCNHLFPMILTGDYEGCMKTYSAYAEPISEETFSKLRTVIYAILAKKYL